MQKLNPTLTPEELTADCSFPIFDLGFLATGAVNCILGSVCLWLSMRMLTPPAAPEQKNEPILAIAAADINAALDNDSNQEPSSTIEDETKEETPLLTDAAIFGLAVPPEFANTFLCDFEVTDNCAALLGETFETSALGTMKGMWSG